MTALSGLLEIQAACFDRPWAKIMWLVYQSKPGVGSCTPQNGDSRQQLNQVYTL